MSAPATQEPSEAVESSQHTVEGIPSAESGKPEEQISIQHIQQLCDRLLQMKRENVEARIIGGKSSLENESTV